MIAKTIGWTIWLALLIALAFAVGAGVRELRPVDEPEEPSACFVEERGVVCP